jgi:cAMP-dependent protein kinase regulator
VQVALLTTKKRQATVKADDNLKLLSLDRKTFKRVLGPIEDLLNRNMEVYNKVRASTV